MPNIRSAITRIAAVQYATKGERIGAILHFAGSIVVPESVDKPLEYYANNTLASHALVTAAVAGGVPHIVFSSTAAVYGEPERVPIEEGMVPTVHVQVDLVGMDVVEVSPPYDHAETTAMAANRVALEVISALSVKRKAGATVRFDPARDLIELEPDEPLQVERRVARVGFVQIDPRDRAPGGAVGRRRAHRCR